MTDPPSHDAHQVLRALTDLLSGRFEVSPEMLSTDTRFGALGLDSLAVAEVELALIKQYGTEIWTDGYNPATTLGEAAAQVAGGRHA
jgi:acyl carrier protein